MLATLLQMIDYLVNNNLMIIIKLCNEFEKRVEQFGHILMV